MASLPEIETLVEAARGGDLRAKRRAVRLLVEAHGGEIFGYLMKRTGDKATAEDLLQRTFLKVLQGLSSLKHTASLRYWLLTIARHQLLDHVRRRSRAPQELPHDAHPDSPHSPAPDPEQRLLARERLRLANDATHALTPRQREVLELAAAGHSNRDIARLLGIRPGTVGALKFKAIERARRALEQREGGMNP